MHVTRLADYRAFLERVYGLESEVELAAGTMLAWAPELEGLRTRVERLRHDLVSLGMTTQEIAAAPRCKAVLARSCAEALGWMFVVERAALLCGLIRRYLATEFPYAVAAASAYLDAYGAGAGHRFRIVGDLIGAQVRQGLADPDATVAAAVRAFQAQRYWYGRLIAQRSRALSQPATTAPRVATSTPADAA